MMQNKYVRLIKEGVNNWNSWRKKNPEEIPDLYGVNLCFFNLTAANFTKTNLWEANMNKARLKNANFRGADLCFANLNGTDLNGVDLGGANLTEADLTGAKITNANLRNANLWGAKLKDAKISYADLSGANLSEADLTMSHLDRLKLRGTNFSDAKLRSSVIRNTDFFSTDLTRSDFTDSTIAWCGFSNMDFRTVKGLDSIIHNGPSSVGIDSILRSSGAIPKSFLLGAGVPDEFVMQMDAIAGSTLEFQSFVLSFSDRDRDFAHKLHKDLTEAGIRCWNFTEEFKTPEQIRKTIHFFDKVLLVMSESSMASNWLKAEIGEAFSEENKRNRSMLFPVCLDKKIMRLDEKWAQELRSSRLLINFEEWENAGRYAASFNQLLKDISRYASRPKSVFPASISLQSTAETVATEAFFTVISKKQCKVYQVGDQLKFDGKTFTPPKDKGLCLSLLEAMNNAHQKCTNDKDSGFVFKCAGCEGMISLACAPEKKQDKKDAETPASSKKTTARSNTMVKLLSSFSLFQTLDKKDIRNLVSFLKVKKFDKKSIVIKKGQPGKNLYIVASGKVAVLGEGGITIAVMGKGEVFGEMSLLTGKPAGATIEVLEASTVLSLAAADFWNMLDNHNSLQMYFTRLLAQRLAEIHKVRSQEFKSGMHGKLSEMPPAELLQTMHVNQKTCVLIFDELSQGKARLCFREGELISAIYKDKVDQDAFNFLLREKTGRFILTNELKKSEKTARRVGDFMGLLMAGVQKIDEGET
ncbi:pentapeptide repeat-containing protein [Desulfobacterales bacterium HSG16]|nr:pentapeptide repeat-containing protein [Desulfobacterales bacterium HSG16]